MSCRTSSADWSALPSAAVHSVCIWSLRRSVRGCRRRRHSCEHRHPDCAARHRHRRIERGHRRQGRRLHSRARSRLYDLRRVEPPHSDRSSRGVRSRSALPRLRCVTTIGAPRRSRAGPRCRRSQDLPTSLLVDCLVAAATTAHVTRPANAWLSPLPTVITLDQLPAMEADDVIPLGLCDLPAQQAQRPFAIDLADGGHLLVAGGPRSGGPPRCAPQRIRRP